MQLWRRPCSPSNHSKNSWSRLHVWSRTPSCKKGKTKRNYYGWRATTLHNIPHNICSPAYRDLPRPYAASPIKYTDFNIIPHNGSYRTWILYRTNACIVYAFSARSATTDELRYKLVLNRKKCTVLGKHRDWWKAYSAKAFLSYLHSLPEVQLLTFFFNVLAAILNNIQYSLTIKELMCAKKRKNNIFFQ